MIDRAIAIQFDRRAGNGRTKPGFVVAENTIGETVELIVKLSANCDRGVTSLALELLCSCLASDLRLPIPKPNIVELEDIWIDSILDLEWADAARRSMPAAFGSSRTPAGFGTWISGTSMVETVVQVASAVLLFDAVTDNPDRRHGNPNCLQCGDEIRIIDHELCFGPMIIGWMPPWQPGALHHLITPGQHIFRDALLGKTLDWVPVTERWKQLSDGMIADYEGAIPSEWDAAMPAVRAAIEKIQNARNRIDDCAIEVQRVLTC